MSQFIIKKSRDPNGNIQYSITWPTRRNVQKYRFLVGTSPGLDDVYSGKTREGTGPGNYTEVLKGSPRKWLQVSYLSANRLGHTTPEQLP